MATSKTCDMPGCTNTAANVVQLGGRIRDTCIDCLSAIKTVTTCESKEWLPKRDAAAAARVAEEKRIAAEDAERAKKAAQAEEDRLAAELAAFAKLSAAEQIKFLIDRFGGSEPRLQEMLSIVSNGKPTK